MLQFNGEPGFAVVSYFILHFF